MSLRGQVAGHEFDIATNIELARRGTRDRLIYASLFAAILLVMYPPWVPAIWLSLVVLWEVVRPRLDQWVLRLALAKGRKAYAIANFTGACLMASVALLGLMDRSPIGVAIAMIWTAGSFLNIFIYFGANRTLLWSCLAPGLVVALLGPCLAFGLHLQSAAITLIIMSNLVAARSFSLDHKTVVAALADREADVSNVERKLAVAIEASGDGLFDLDLATDECHVSETWLTMLGYKSDEVSMPIKNWRDYIYPDDLPMLEAQYAAHFRGEILLTSAEHRMVCQNGDPKWVLARGRLVQRSADGAPMRMVGTIMDLTARKTLEHKLESALHVAESANRAKEVFLANMSHEIRTQLNGVIGTAGALARRNLPTEEAEMVDLIRSSGETLDRLLSDILDQAKMEAGQFTLQVEPFDLRKEVEIATELMRARADERGLGFLVAYDAAARGEFAGDAIRIRQIISNLASNAIKFTESGEVRVTVSAEEPENPGDPTMLRIEVVDSGMGFDAETAERLFARFTQADSSISRKFGGTGLGLAISKTLVELMNGTISAKGEPGMGAVFTVRIPLQRTVTLADYDLGRSSGRQSPNPEGEGGETLGALRIMLAEDHPTNQRVVQLILAPLGVALTIAADGREAVRLFQTAAFDLILMDMQMPILDGLAATREIRNLERAAGRDPTPIAMLTANAMADHRRLAESAGANHLISKPITPESLILGIEHALAGPADLSCALTTREAV